ncbi:MAG: glycosyltransferase [Moraxellaceae bacterium]|nr:MAG: glycosyltransferase [Moraxellaceae bacterium]
MTACALRQDADILMLGGFPLLKTTSLELTQQLAEALKTHEQYVLVFANTNFIVKCQPLQKAMQEANTIIVNDGIGVDIGTWMIHREKFPENLNGTDFIPHYLHHVKDKGRVFLLGAKPGIALRAATTLENDFSVNVVGTADGYGQANNTNQLIAEINSSGANIILVAMGNPWQEKWILDHRHELKASVFIGVGALLDFLAGEKPRAPGIVQKLRLEWFYRLCLEPTRLMRRYTLDIVIFLTLCLRTEKWRKHNEQLR